MSQIDECLKDIITPENAQLCAVFKRSFAYYTLQVRLPIILTKIIDQLVRDKEEIIKSLGHAAKEEIKQVIGSLSKLKTDLQTNKQFELIRGTGSDVTIWNKFIESSPKPLQFYTASFLYTECYMYRRIREAFELTSSLREFDYFQKQKDESLVQAQFAVNTVAKHINQTRNDHDYDDLKNEFLRLLKLCLWGNRCDLSISAGSDNAQTTDPLASLTKLADKTVVDDSIEIWSYLENIRKSDDRSTTIDFVTDNAGYEFFMDLCVSDFLLTHKFAFQIRFFVKAIPWFISDVTARDFEHIINHLHNDKDENTSALGERLSGYLEQKRFLLIVDNFWTSPYEFCKMPEINKSLYEKLSESVLVFFKGDLNYRKLLGEKNWDPTTEFKIALQGFLPTTVCTLRTIKADIICGLDRDRYDELNEQHGCMTWMTTGEYAVIQCALK